MPTPSDHRKRVLSGMRSTGKLHLGNYVGALQNWVSMQDQYECFFFVADWHALTTDYADTSRVKENSIEVLLDWLAAGLDPERCTMFIQSHVPQHAELHLLFSMITPLGWLERVPTYKEQKENIAEKDLNTYGFLGYPVLQAADILIYKGNFVPVGEDQVPHVELTREIARRFNNLYSPMSHPLYEPGVPLAQTAYRNPLVREVFPEPQPLLTNTPKLPGTDGRKMSKSYGNAIMLADPEAVVREKMRTMVNDPERVHRTDPGNPERCPVGDMHKVFSPLEVVNDVYVGCTSARISCTECKSWAANAIVSLLTPIQERRIKFESDPKTTLERLKASSSKAQISAEETMREVREVMGLSQNYGFSLEQIGKSTITPNTKLYGPAQWFGLDYEIFFEAICEHWRKCLPSNLDVRPGEGTRRFRTSSIHRIGVAATRELEHEQFVFKPLDRHDDVLVLLGFSREFEILPFVLPRRILQANWKTFEREPRKDIKKKGELVRLVIRREGPNFLLEIPNAAPLPLNEFRSNYAPFL